MCGETSTLVSGGARLPLDEKGWRSEHHPDGEQDTVKLEQCAAVVTVAVSYGRRKGDDTDRDESLRVVGYADSVAAGTRCGWPAPSRRIRAWPSCTGITRTMAVRSTTRC